MKSVKAWHFLADSGKLRDGRPAVDGEWLLHTGPAVMCESGLHASRKVTDALRYAPGSILCRVECRGVVEERADKLLCLERKILWRIDSTDVLRRFARMCALDVIDLWNAPAVVVEFLSTGETSLRDAAGDAARAAARVALDAAWVARDAAGAAAGAAARVAGDAARDAARAAARAAARDAGAAARDAGDAARAAARVARDAARAAALVALDAAGAAARARQDRRLVALVYAEHKRVQGGGV